MERFAIREATLADADGIAVASVDSWRSSYRGVLPDTVLDRIDVVRRAARRRELLRDRRVFQLVAYEVSPGDIVGYCDAGPSRHTLPSLGEIYEIYLVDRAKRHGLGSEMFACARDWLRERGMTSMVVWVLDNNHFARRFYEARGGALGAAKPSRIGGSAIVEQAYVWDRT